LISKSVPQPQNLIILAFGKWTVAGSRPERGGPVPVFSNLKRRLLTMTGRERALGAFNRTGYDRIPVKHEGTPEVNQMIMDHFGLTNMEQLLRVVGDDFRYVELPYTGPELRTFPDGSMEGYWGERYKYAQFEGGKYLEPSYLPFAGIDKLEELDRSHFPSSDWW